MTRDEDYNGMSAEDSDVAVDSVLSDDLGAEYEFRGDVLEAELESARREAAAHLEIAQRLQAEFDNYRRRVAREQEGAIKRAGARVVEGLLPSIDNLERALAHVESGSEVALFAEGVEMILKSILDVLGKEGVERIEPMGQVFDPMEHQAVGQAQRPDVSDGTVVEVYECGYRMHDRVLRPATVIVSTGGPVGGE